MVVVLLLYSTTELTLCRFAPDLYALGYAPDLYAPDLYAPENQCTRFLHAPDFAMHPILACTRYSVQAPDLLVLYDSQYIGLQHAKSGTRLCTRFTCCK
jgi:hypothetical protein